MYSSTIRRGRIFHFRADKATLASQGTNSPQISAPLDWSGNYTPSIVNSGYTTTSGWSGAGTTLDPYRLILDGVNDYLDTKHIPQLTDKWSMELWIKIPNVVSKETTTIWGTNGTGNGYWMPGFSYSKSNKKLNYGHDYYGNPTFEYGTIADHIINPGDIIQIGLVFDGCKHVRLYLNGILLMDSTFTLTPTATSSNLIGGNIPTTAYYGYGNIEVISCSIFSKLLSATEILRSYQGNEDPLYKTSLSQMNRGDYISCRYTATSGQVGIFSEFGTCIAPEIPVTGTATPDGLFYLIMAGYDSQGRKKLVADRNIQTGVSWDTLNSAGICSGLPITFSNITYTDNLIPSMTSNNTPSGIASSNSTYAPDVFGPFKAFNKILETEGWECKIDTTNILPIWLRYQFALAKKICKYTVLVSSSTNQITWSPKSWVFQGSNNGADWTTLDTRDNITSWSNINRSIFTFKNDNSYLYYQIKLLAVNSTYVTISEIEMMEAASPDSLASYNFSLRLPTGGTSATDKENEWDKIIVESSLGGTITPGDDSVWHWNNIWSWTSTNNYVGSTVRTLRGKLAVTTNSQSSTTSGNGFRPVILVEDTSAPVVTVVTRFMLQQGTNIFDINPANYSTPPTNISELHVVEPLTDTIIEQSGGGWDDVVNYLSLFKGTKYKILKFVRNE